MENYGTATKTALFNSSLQRFPTEVLLTKRLQSANKASAWARAPLESDFEHPTWSLEQSRGSF